MSKVTANYGNWMPEEMVYGAAAGSAVLAAAALGVSLSGNRYRRILAPIAAGSAAACGAYALYSAIARAAFSYDGKRKLSRDIIDGIAGYVTLPDGGRGLDVGCGSGALTIACAKKNPRAQMLGIDTWGPEYQAFSRIVCEKNAAAEGVTNARFEKGNACHLDYPDESFDCVVSNYVYHNIFGKDRRKILRESLRVLKKGGTFAIHDLMSKGRFGDMHAFADSLQAEGYQEVHLTDTTKQFFHSPAEARLLMLGSSTLLWGTK